MKHNTKHDKMNSAWETIRRYSIDDIVDFNRRDYDPDADAVVRAVETLTNMPISVFVSRHANATRWDICGLIDAINREHEWRMLEIARKSKPARPHHVWLNDRNVATGTVSMSRTADDEEPPVWDEHVGKRNKRTMDSLVDALRRVADYQKRGTVLLRIGYVERLSMSEAELLARVIHSKTGRVQVGDGADDLVFKPARLKVEAFMNPMLDAAWERLAVLFPQPTEIA